MRILYLTLFSWGLLNCSHSAWGNFSTQTNYKIFRASQQSTQQALCLYLDALDTYKEHDYILLRKIAENCLRQSLNSIDAQTKEGAILGAGFARSAEALDLLALAMEDSNPMHQLLVLSVLASNPSKTSNELLFKALASPYPFIRLEAAYQLASLKNTKVVDHLHSFIHKLPEEVRALSAAIFLRLETEESDAYIKELLASPKPITRNYTALLIGEYQQKRFIPSLRSLLTSASYSDQEGALYALGKLKDGQTYQHIKHFLNKESPDLALAAAQALIYLGNEEEALPIIKQQAQEHKPRALYTARLLSKEEGIPLLLPIFLNSSHAETKLNAGLALLHLGCTHSELIEYFTLWLETPNYHQIITLSRSQGQATSSWKFTPIIFPTGDAEKRKLLTTIHQTEEFILNLLLFLPGEASLPYIERILQSQKTHLAAKAILYLSQLSNKQSLNIIAQATMYPGEPIIRAYANLALYHLTKDPEQKTILHQQARSLIQQTLLFIGTESESIAPQATYLRYQVTPELRAQLMLDILETLVSTKTHDDIRCFLQLMAQTNTKNLPVLSGLLMKMIE